MAFPNKFPKINQELLSQLRGLFFSKDNPIMLPNNGFIGLHSIDTPATLPPFPYRFVYVKADGYPYILDYEGNEYRLALNILDDIKISQLWEADEGTVAWQTDNDGNLESQGGVLDLDGVADGLVLDADGDTTISAPTDDQIDVEVGGSDVVVINGNSIIIDSAEDTNITIKRAGNNLIYIGDPGADNKGAVFLYDAAGNLRAQMRIDASDRTIFGAYSNHSLALTTNNTTKVTIDTDGNVGINITSPTAKLHVDQSSTVAAMPVLLLDQADVSEEMIEFASTVGTGNAIEAVGTKTLTTTHFIKVTIAGVGTRYIPVGTIA